MQTDRTVSPHAGGTELGTRCTDRTSTAPDTDGIWYASYPPDVPHDINVDEYTSIPHFFDECTTRFRERIAFVSIGSSMSYGSLAEM